MNTQEIEDKFSELLALGDNWDGYGAVSIKEGSVSRAKQIIAQAMNEDRLQIIPINSGGIMLNWHVQEFELSIEISPTGKFIEVGIYGLDNIPDIFKHILDLNILRS